MAEAVDAFRRRPFRDSSGEAHAGLVTGADLAAFSATWEEPATSSTGSGFAVAKTGPWGQGPVLLQALALLDALDDPTALDPSTADGIHAVAEVLKLALADREAWYGDGADVPLATLLAPAYAAERRALVGERASRELRPGAPGRARAAAARRTCWTGAPAAPPADPTTRGADGGTATA